MRKVVHVGLVEWIRRASSFDARSSGLEPSKNTPEALEAPREAGRTARSLN